jgi:succinyl-CoA synthetase beta subunit
MNIHEYQAKELLRRFGVPTPQGAVARSVEEAVAVAKTLGPGKLVVKAQIHAGGRGKAGGVKVVDGVDGVRKAAAAILGMTLITPQTGPGGKVVRALLVEEGSAIRKEYYAGITLDRASRRMCFMVSREGGMNIEDVAEKFPESIRKVFVDPRFGLQNYEARMLALGLGFSGKAVFAATAMFMNLYKAVLELDAALVEINPLVITEGGELIALDAKVSFDDSALFRHKDLEALEDLTETDPQEHRANAMGMKFITLEGSIGMMANGAGLAMTTMDIIQQMGGKAANFLDVSGGASEEMVAEGTRLILEDPAVKALFINIFGGILRGDILARGLLMGLGNKASPVPVIMRMVGTNADEGRRILEDSGLPFTLAANLSQAMVKIAEVVRAQQ